MLARTLSGHAPGRRRPRPSPEARYEQTEAVSLAFIIALQLLPARQRAVLVLRDVLGYHAHEVAAMLDASLDTVNGLLKRTRAALRRRLPAGDREPPPAPNSPEERALVDKFVRAFKAGDINALVKLLTAEVKLSMPPVPLEYQGLDVVARFYAALFDRGRTYDLVPTRANGQLAFGNYVHTPDGTRRPSGLVVITLAGDRISDIVRFDNNVLPWFGLPQSLR
jgi:hypothetical protein